MAVSKRVRFEVFRRDGFKCRYCGLAGPEGAGLTIDHVVPVSLGGSDAPNNLVAACKDCNAGKTSSSPDAPLVAQVSDDAVRWAAAMKQSADDLMVKLGHWQELSDRFVSHWSGWDKRLSALPAGYEHSVEGWIKAGLPIDALLADVDKAWANQKVPTGQVFRYMAGIAWSQVTEMQEAAKAALVGAAQPEPERREDPCYPCFQDEGESCPFLNGTAPRPASQAFCEDLFCETCHAYWHGWIEGLPDGYRLGNTDGYHHGACELEGWMMRPSFSERHAAWPGDQKSNDLLDARTDVRRAIRSYADELEEAGEELSATRIRMLLLPGEHPDLREREDGMEARRAEVRELANAGGNDAWSM